MAVPVLLPKTHAGDAAKTITSGPIGMANCSAQIKPIQNVRRKQQQLESNSLLEIRKRAKTEPLLAKDRLP